MFLHIQYISIYRGWMDRWIEYSELTVNPIEPPKMRCHIASKKTLRYSLKLVDTNFKVLFIIVTSE